jgi:histidine triad (HIT) family protein
MSDCLFCKILAGSIPAKIAYRDEQCVAFHDVNPQAPVHLLVVPLKHVESLLRAADDDVPLLGHLQSVAAKLAKQHQLEAGFRTVFNNGLGAGQSVFHLHLHLLGGRKFEWPPG